MLRRVSEYKKMKWKNGGGTTLEIARSPENDDQEFNWRLSMAYVDAPGGPFSVFPGVDRTLCILDGDSIELILDNGNNEIVYLDQNSPPYSFPGELPIVCNVKAQKTITDLNVMTRRNKYQHSLERITIIPGQDPIEISSLNGDIVFVVIAQGEVQTHEIKMTKGDALRLDDNHPVILISTSAEDTMFFLIRLIKLIS